MLLIHWNQATQKSSLGTDPTDDLVRRYINPSPAARVAAYRAHNELPHRLQREYTVSSTHSNTGGRRNPGRGDGQTWNGDSFICASQIDPDYSNVDPSIDRSMMSCDDYDERDYCDQEATRPRTIEISLADVPMKVRKPKQRA